MAYLGTVPAPQPLSNADLGNAIVDNRVLANGSVTVNKISATGTPTASTFLSGTGAWSSVSNVAAVGPANSVQFQNAAGNGLQGSGNLQYNDITRTLSLIGTVAVIDAGTGNTTFTVNGATGNVITQGILTDGYYYANGAPLDFQQPASPNLGLQFNFANGFGATSNLIFDPTTNQLTLTGTANINNLNITNNFFGNNVSATGNVTAGNLNSNATVTAVSVIASGNVLSGNLNTFGAITGANLTTASFATFGGNVTAPNAIVTNAFITTSATIAGATLAGNSITANTGVFAGNVTAGNLITSGTIFGNIVGNIQGNFTVPGANTQVLFNDSGLANSSAGLTFNKATNAVTATGIVTAGALQTAGNVSAAGSNTQIQYNNQGNLAANSNFTFNTATQVFSAPTANVTTLNAAGNVAITGATALTGNLTAGNAQFVGTVTVANLSTTGNIQAAGSNTQVLFNDAGNIGAASNFLFTRSTGTLAVPQANVTTINATTAVITGNASAGNLVNTNVYGEIFGNLRTQGSNGQIAVANASTGRYEAANITAGAGIIVTANSTGIQITANAQSVVAPGSNTNIIFNNAGNLDGSNALSFNRQANSLTVSGNITVNNVFATSAQLTSITATAAANFGTVDATGNITATGNLQGTYVLGNGAFLTGLPAQYSNANVANYLPIYGGNILAGNLQVNNNVVITGNLQVNGNTTFINANSLVVTDKEIVLANGSPNPAAANGAGIVVDGAAATFLYNFANNAFESNISLNARGNVQGTYILGNGAFLTGLPAQYTNANVANYLVTYGGNAAFGNISIAQNTAGNTATFTGNVTAGNVSTTNITAANITSTSQATLGNTTFTTTAQFSNSTVTFGTGATNVQVYGSNGSVYANAFYGNFVGNIQGNLTVAGPNTGVVFNDAGVANSTAGFTFNKATNALSASGTLAVTGNATVGNLVATIATLNTAEIAGRANALSVGLISGASSRAILRANVASDANTVFQLPSTNGVANASLLSDGTGNTFWGSIIQGAAGTNRNIQFNDSGLFGGTNNFVWTTSNEMIANGAIISANSYISANAGTVFANAVSANSATVAGNIAAGNVLTNNLLYANGTPWDLQQPAGSNTQIQFNDGNSNFGASSAFTFDRASNVMTVGGNASAGYYLGNGSVLQGIFTTVQTRAQGNVQVILNV